MSHVRPTIISLFIAALFFATTQGQCAEQHYCDMVEQQIAERTKQYQTSLRQRAEKLSPALQSKIESQVQQTVSKKTIQWRKGKINLRIALPRLAEVQRAARLVKHYLPNSGSPTESFEFGIGTTNAAVVVSSPQHVVKLLAVSNLYSIFFRCSSISPLRHGRNVLSYFVQVVCTIVQRR